MDELNAKFAAELLFLDMESNKELRPDSMYDEGDGVFVIFVSSEDGALRYKHTIKTEEV